jgi:hypothetical protein
MTMRKAILAGVLSLGVLGVAYVPPARSLDKDTPPVKPAIERGVGYLRSQQQRDGTWPPQDASSAFMSAQAVRVGATALVGLTQLECGVGTDDRSVAAAAEAVRKGSVDCKHTYALALSILFLDKYGDPADLPLIESMGLRLLAGQFASGGWGYTCPSISAEEMQRLSARPRGNELVGRRELPKPGGPRRTPKDVSPQVQDQLAFLRNRGPFTGDQNVGAALENTDNSNTQFATLALWVLRRYGLPVDDAVKRVDARFRTSQGADGGWGYNLPSGGLAALGGGSSATMTCGGILGLLVAHGTVADLVRTKDRKPHDVEKDPNLVRALAAVSTAIDHPVGDDKDRAVPTGIGGKSYYFLWSLERICVILSLERLAGKDWYNWGAEILLRNQQGDGSWKGDFANECADTCFALLFLTRANLATDLTAGLKFKDPGATLKAGGLGGKALKEAPPPKLSAIEGKHAAKAPGGKPAEARPGAGAPEKSRPAESESARLADELVKAPPAERGTLLQKLQEARGVVNTEALAFAIPRLEGDARQKAREALTSRMARLKAESLTTYLEDEEPEIRRAAALACAVKGLKAAVPNLIARLGDRDDGVAQAAHAALKDLTGQNLGTSAAEWEAWWKKQGKE